MLSICVFCWRKKHQKRLSSHTLQSLLQSSNLILPDQGTEAPLHKINSFERVKEHKIRIMESNGDRLFRLPFKLPNSATARSIGVYISGGLYAVGAWLFLDAVIYSKKANASSVHVTFVDWIPFLCSTLGMIIVNSIEKNRLIQDALASGSFSGSSSMAWQARLVLFLGFALLAGGLSGSIVVLIIKFLIKDFTTYPTLGMGVNNVVGNFCVVLSCVILWIAQNVEDEYSYSLTL